MTRALVIGVLLASSISAQGIITTLAGTDWIFPGDGKPAKDAPLGVQSMGVALDRQSNLFIADQLNHMVLKVSADGILTIVAGNGVPGFAGENGPARSASLNRPSDVIVLPDGTLYVADSGNSRIRKITLDGIISVIAGTNRAQFAGDGGPATSASLNNPGAMASDANGALYIADGGNRVRKISAEGIMSTVAGNGQEGFSGDGGPALDATFFFLTGVALDGSGNLYITDRSNHRIRKVTADGIITTVAGDGRALLAGDNGPAVTASLRFPSRLAFDNSGNLYVTDTGNGRVRKISPSGVITTAVALSLPDSIAVDSSSTLYVTQRGGLVALVSPGGTATTSAGNGAFRAFPEGSLAANAFLFGPIGTFLDAAGNLLVADSTNARVRRITPDGRIFTVAGTGVPACGSDGRPPLLTGLGSPAAIAMDQAGRLYFSDATCGNVRRLGPDGTLTIVAGGGVGLLDTGRPANLTSLDSPQGITFDRAGNLLIVETGAQRIRRVTPEGTISTIAGNGQRGFSGDNGPATNASFSDPSGIAVDNADNLYIADRRNNRVRRITPDGIISTYAGNARGAFAGDGGPATSASLAAPHRVTFDAGGNLYIADEGNHRIRLVTPNGVISTIAGNGTAGFSGDGGLATDASLRTPKDVAIAADGTLYIADLGNDRIRVISKLAPRILASASTLSFSAKSGGPVSQATTIGLSSSVAGVPFSIGISTSSGGSWLRANPASGTIPATAEISADPSGLAPGTYRGTVNINAPSALPAVLAVSVTLVVEPGEPARLGAELRSLSFSFTRQSGSASSQVVISNRGSGALNFAASSTTAAGGAWLAVSPASGSLTPANPATLTVTANPAGLNPGTYGGRVAIRSTTTNEILDLPVTMTISAIQQSILLSQTGLAFTAVAGGGVVLPQTFGIVNTGQGVMSWSVRASTLSGGSNWLSVRPASGSTNALSLNVPLVEVGVDASRLAPGEYYGQVDVIAPGADNSPQNVSVVLNVLPPGSNPGPVVRPTGLIFTGVADGDSPGSQDVLVSNLTSGSTNYTSGRLTSDGQSWFVHVPGSATVTPDQPGRIVVQADLAGLTGGIRRGVLTLLFQDGTARTVNLLLVLVRSRGLSSKAEHRADGCTPTALLPVFTSLGTDFSVPGGWPVPVEARVVDDCGDPLTSGSVVATFSNGDVPLALVPLRDGRWSGTWQARNSTTAQVTISLAAQNPAQSVRGNAQLTGGLRANLNPPQVLPGGVVSAASLAAGAPLAPGSVVSIFGSRLSDSRLQATQLPLDTQLAGSLVTIAGRALPLLFASDGQINAMLPYDIPVNVRHQIAVRRGSSLTVPEPVTVAEAQPAIFTKDQSGKGQGVIIDVQNRYVESGNGARAGDAVVIYCSGLGAVDPPVVAGAAAPPAPLSRTVNQVALTIGGVRAEVFFAGLAPGFAGLYQVNAYVPQGAPIADAVPVVLTVAGQASPAVTMAVR